MPAKITDEEKLPKIPNLDVAQWKFYIKMNPNCGETQKKLKDEIKEKEMAPFYAQMCDELGQKPGNALEFYCSIYISNLTTAGTDVEVR